MSGSASHRGEPPRLVVQHPHLRWPCEVQAIEDGLLCEPAVRAQRVDHPLRGWSDRAGSVRAPPCSTGRRSPWTCGSARARECECEWTSLTPKPPRPTFPPQMPYRKLTSRRRRTLVRAGCDKRSVATHASSSGPTSTTAAAAATSVRSQRVACAYVGKVCVVRSVRSARRSAMGGVSCWRPNGRTAAPAVAPVPPSSFAWMAVAAIRPDSGVALCVAP